MKKITALLLIVFLITCSFTFTSCDETPTSIKETTIAKSEATTIQECLHEWKEATCTTPKTCSICSKTEGTALEHSWKSATCTTPKTCSICKTTSGSALGHNYKETISVPASCSQSGLKSFSCVKCKKSYSEKYSMEALSANEIYEQTKQSVGEIITYNKSGVELALGTGFVYSKDGKIITNYHVIEEAYSAKITINGTVYKIQQVLAYDKDIDLIVLKINANNLTPLSICKSNHLVGQSVYAFGSSKGLTATFSQGIITYTNRKVDNVIYTQHDAAISSGNSGGPLINQYGEVIGINTWTVRDSQNLNFAISTSEIDKLIYRTPLTVTQLYEKECNTYTKLKNYIVANGTYSSGEYTLTFEKTQSNGLYIERTAYYDVENKTISFTVGISQNNYTAFCGFIVDVIDGSYAWLYLDADDYMMSGTITASSFTENHLLGYDYCNAPTSLKADIRSMASTMIDHILINFNYDFNEINVTIDDIGFISF